MRGIRNLDIAFDQKTFSISGPNGSGKSGVIDAIEFGLTGRISRLTGTGTKSLSIAEHGPHVDRVRFPDAALVTLKVYFTALKRSATITRKVSAPKKPKIEPADPDIKAAFEQLADHPEIALSRRDILRFILVEPSRRAEEVQAILKLEEIGERRTVLNSAQNRVNALKRTAEAQFQTARSSLLTHMQIPSVKIDDLLAAANARRKLLGLPLLDQLTPDTRLDAGLTSSSSASAFNKQSALRDLAAMAGARKQLPELAKDEVAALLATMTTLADDPALLASLRRRTLVEQGIELIDGPHCPLCDSPWRANDICAITSRSSSRNLTKRSACKGISSPTPTSSTARCRVGSRNSRRSAGLPRRLGMRHSSRRSISGPRSSAACKATSAHSMGFAASANAWRADGMRCRRDSMRQSQPSKTWSPICRTRRPLSTLRPFSLPRKSGSPISVRTCAPTKPPTSLSRPRPAPTRPIARSWMPSWKLCTTTCSRISAPFIDSSMKMTRVSLPPSSRPAPASSISTSIFTNAAFILRVPFTAKGIRTVWACAFISP
nr:ATP-binding protein [Bradyrhizobium sp. 160]